MRSLATAGLLVFYAAVFLYPFRWSPPRRVANEAERTPSGWRFPAAGLARSLGPAPFPRGRFDLKLRIRTARTDQSGPARIFTISRDPSLRNLTLGQEGTDLVLRVRAPGTTLNGMPQSRISGVFDDDRWHAVEVTVGGDTVALSVDGAQRLRRAYAGPVTATWDRGYRIALGNELTGRRPWLGEIEYDGALERPESYWSMQHAPRWVPFRELEGADVVLNAFAFVPLGVLLVRLGWSRSTALFLSAGLSLGIELTQLGLADRFASTTDLLLNGCGALVGVVAARRSGGKQNGSVHPEIGRSLYDFVHPRRRP
jgi:hypothetical protein